MAGVVRLMNIASTVGFAVAAGSFIVSECLFNVDGGHRAVLWHRFRDGVMSDVLGEGTHFRIPFVTYPTIFDIRIRPRIVTTETGTKDMQQVKLSLRVLSHPIPEKLPEIYRTLGEDFDERILPSIVNEVLKATVAQYDAEQLLTARERVSWQIREALKVRAAEFNLELDDVSITHLQFSREFSAAIESKQVAQQDAERSKFIVMKAEQERNAAIIRAEGESMAAQQISAAIKQHGSALVDVKRIDAAKEIAETLASSPNVLYLPNTNLMMAMPAVNTRAHPPPVQ